MLPTVTITPSPLEVFDCVNSPVQTVLFVTTSRGALGDAIPIPTSPST